MAIDLLTSYRDIYVKTSKYAEIEDRRVAHPYSKARIILGGPFLRSLQGWAFPNSNSLGICVRDLFIKFPFVA